jgi:hypothetical protein
MAYSNSRILLLLLGLSLGHCGRSRDQGAPSAPDDAEALVVVGPGRRAIVESSRAVFAEGVISRVSGERAAVRIGMSDEAIDVPIGDIYLPLLAGSAGESAVRAQLGGEPHFAVCHMPDGRWRGCRVDSVTGQAAHVVDDEATAADLPLAELLVPTAVTELNVRQRFERNAKRRAFREGARLAGRPRVPSRWRPMPRDQVIARRDGVWAAAEVKQLSRGSARVLWPSDGRTSDVALSDVAPEPPIDFAATAGSYVLVRPASGGRTWSVMRVETTGVSTLVVSDEGGDVHDVALRDVLPLDRTSSD